MNLLEAGLNKQKEKLKNKYEKIRKIRRLVEKNHFFCVVIVQTKNKFKKNGKIMYRYIENPIQNQKRSEYLFSEGLQGLGGFRL